MEITHFYDKIKFDIPVEGISIPENLRVEEFDNGVFFDIQKAANNVPIISKGVVSSSELQISEKSTFLKGKVNIGSDIVDFKVWNNDDGKAYHYDELFKKERFIDFRGKINIYNGNKSVVIEKATPLHMSSETLNYLPKTKESRMNYIAELLYYIEQLHPGFKEIALKFLNKYGKHFFEAPAALGHHHNYLGGLLIHTVGLMRVVQFIKNYDDPVKACLYLYNMASNQYINDIWGNYDSNEEMKNDFNVTWANSLDHLMNMTRTLARLFKGKENINWDVVFTAILFHDTGKIIEYSYFGEDDNKFKLLYPNCSVSEFSKGGIGMDNLKGQSHVPLSAMILMDVINSTHDVIFTDVEIAMMNNAIFAHHGKLEWGSPSLSEYPESVIVHFADLCDSRFEKDRAKK